MPIRTVAAESQEKYPRPYVHHFAKQAPAGGDACAGVAENMARGRCWRSPTVRHYLEGRGRYGPLNELC